MADHYSSCQSIMLLNVSEDHTSTAGSPVSAPGPHAIVQRSPVIRAEEIERDDFRAEPTDIVEDSYKQSLQNETQPGRLSPAHQDSGDELYELSPKAKVKLDAKLQAKEVVASEQVIAG